jgi:HNH endonuclease
MPQTILDVETVRGRGQWWVWANSTTAGDFTSHESNGMKLTSHIRPWRDSDNRQRLDPFNGLLLAPQLDALFDAGLISFEDSGQILLPPSPSLSTDDRRLLGVHPDLKLRKIDERHKPYLSRHRKKHGFEQ